MLPIETKRLRIRELQPETDAAFIHSLLNSPKFLQYIGDRGVRTADEAAEFIETRYRESYRHNGYGLYAVELKDAGTQIGMCGFVRRENLDAPDIGFAYLPEYEGRGYGFEAAKEMMAYGQEELAFYRVLAITTPENHASIGLLEKLGFTFESLIEDPQGKPIRLMSYVYPDAG